MDDMQTFTYIMALKDKLPADSLLFLQDELKKMPNDKVVNLSQVKLKEPIIGLILGIFFGFFAADRFYQNIKSGILKLFLLIIMFFLGGCAMVNESIGGAMFICSITAVWIMLDWYFVWTGIKQDNLTKIKQSISIT